MALILALLSAAFYGTADFLGGLAARRSAALAATVVAQGCGLVLVALALPLFPAAPPSAAGALWGAGAGMTGGVGVALLYYGLAGAFFVCLARAGNATGLWPLLIARATSTLALAAAARLARVPLSIPRKVVPVVAACGALDMVANALYLIAVREGPLGLVATLASLCGARRAAAARTVAGARVRGGRDRADHEPVEMLLIPSGVWIRATR